MKIEVDFEIQIVYTTDYIYSSLRKVRKINSYLLLNSSES